MVQPDAPECHSGEHFGFKEVPINPTVLAEPVEVLDLTGVHFDRLNVAL